MTLLPRFLATLAILSMAVPGAVAADESPEYQVKAVYLFNFAKFVEWPAPAFGSAEAPIVIGVLGTDPFGSLLDRAVAGERVGGRAIKVERYSRIQDVGTCHILFIARSETARLPAIFAALAGRSMLTIGEMDGFATSGGIIRLLSVDDRVRFRINLDAAKAARLTISSKLLRPSELIQKGD